MGSVVEVIQGTIETIQLPEKVGGAAQPPALARAAALTACHQLTLTMVLPTQWCTAAFSRLSSLCLSHQAGAWPCPWPERRSWGTTHYIPYALLYFALPCTLYLDLCACTVICYMVCVPRLPSKLLEADCLHLA